MRLFAGLTQVELAKTLRVSQGWLSKVEIGQLELAAQHISVLRTVFGISADAILDGGIPYSEIARRSGRIALLPPRYRQDPKISIRAAFPFLDIYQKRLPKAEVDAVIRALEVKKYVFADPALPVNVLFLWDLISEGYQRGIFERKSVFRELSNQAIQLFQSEELSLIARVPWKSRDFFEKWIELACRIGGGHQFSLVSIDAASAVVEARCSILLCRKQPKLADIFDEYYRNLLSLILSEQQSRGLEVEMRSVDDQNAPSTVPFRTVRYGVRWN